MFNEAILKSLLKKAPRGFEKANLNTIDNLLYRAGKQLSHDKEYFVTDSLPDFRYGHRAPGFDPTPLEQRLGESGDFNLAEVLQGHHNVPKDFFGPMGPRNYGYGRQPEGMESYRVIQDLLNSGRDRVTAYRAVPKDLNINNLIDEDWVTLSKKYANTHGMSNLDNNYNLIQQEVPTNQLWWDGNDINEWGFDTGSGMAEALRNDQRNFLSEIWEMANRGL